MTIVLAHIGLGDDQLSMSRLWLFSALAMALSSVFADVLGDALVAEFQIVQRVAGP
jgi:hypothetical protein